MHDTLLLGSVAQYRLSETQLAEQCSLLSAIFSLQQLHYGWFTQLEKAESFDGVPGIGLHKV